jgi:hypothetical protein
MSINEIIRSDLERLPCFRGVAYVAEGAFGKVFGASYVRNGGEARKVAIKVLPRAHGKYSNVQREILIHNRLIHPHIIQFKTLVLLEDYMGIVMEYADLGNLHQDFIRRHGGHFRDSDIRKLFQQLILAVDYCHRKGIVSCAIAHTQQGVQRCWLLPQVLPIVTSNWKMYCCVQSRPLARRCSSSPTLATRRMSTSLLQDLR